MQTKYVIISIISVIIFVSGYFELRIRIYENSEIRKQVIENTININAIAKWIAEKNVTIPSPQN